MVSRATTRGVCIVLLVWLSMASTASYAQQGPSIAFADSVCFGGRMATLIGQGFLPGDTVYLDALPPVPRHLPIPPSQPSEGIRLGMVTVGADGQFTVQISLADPITGRSFGGSPAGDTEYYAIEAFPASFGASSAENSSRAPKAVCAAAPNGAVPPTAPTSLSRLPATGTGHAAG